jgi:hypothetical protein
MQYVAHKKGVLFLVPHGALLKPNGGECGSVDLHLLLELGDLGGDALLQILSEVLQLWAALLLDVDGDGHSPEKHFWMRFEMTVSLSLWRTGSIRHSVFLIRHGVCAITKKSPQKRVHFAR